MIDLHYKLGLPGGQTANIFRIPISLWPKSVFSNLAAHQNPLGALSLPGDSKAQPRLETNGLNQHFSNFYEYESP